MSKLRKFDAAEYLDTPERQAAYLAAAMETGDAAFVRDALGIVARAVGPSKVAIAAHLNRVSLYKALGPTGNPGFATVMGILGALGLTMSVRPAGRRKKHPAKAVSGIVAKSKPPHYHFSRRAD
ncbi:MAG: addiction module antidote protein [Pseudolabrys sp.]|jgi:probable addiction module antidote protein|nr:addiction module antidote protein [Pseudolabrys sp.]